LVRLNSALRCDALMSSTAASLASASSLNYLVDSGHCFVVMGLARGVVEAQLAHHYASIAQSVGKLEAVHDGSTDTSQARYARDYLRKLATRANATTLAASPRRVLLVP
jgi:hypothetical protein